MNRTTIPTYFGLPLLFVLFVLACSPKTTTVVSTPETTPTSPTPAPADENLSDCPKFSDAPDPDSASDNYVIYRNFMRTKEYAEALPRWRKVYNLTPAADGKRNTVYMDGVRLYNYLSEQNPDRRAVYGDTIQMLYSQARECYPNDGFTAAMQGFDAYYTYEGSATHQEIFEMFRESIEKDGEDLEYFIINPMSALLVEMHDSTYIDDDEAKRLAFILLGRLEKGLADCQGADCEPWYAIRDYAPSRLEYFEKVRGFYDCQHFVDKYMPEFEENSTDCDVIRTTFARIRWGNCGADHPAYKQVEAAYNANCRVIVTSSSGSVRAGYDALENNDYRLAIEKFEQAANETDDVERKGRYLMLVAKIYYSHLKNFSRARSYARKAADARPNWGEPFLLIGRLYASSGPLCGPGRGFDSQVVVWPAIDMWNRAKSVDPEAAAEANKFIGRYRQYMPSREDVFQRNLKIGDTFRVGCWIQETTRIRTP